MAWNIFHTSKIESLGNLEMSPVLANDQKVVEGLGEQKINTWDAQREANFKIKTTLKQAFTHFTLLHFCM